MPRVPCRAAWKLQEVFNRLPELTRVRTCQTSCDTTATISESKGWVALDIGASPGGWSYFLAGLPNCRRVLAVDPGKMKEPVPSLVTHLAQRVEDVTPDLLKGMS